MSSAFPTSTCNNWESHLKTRLSIDSNHCC